MAEKLRLKKRLVQTTLFGSRTHEKKDFYDNPKNNYEIFANEIANEMSGNASRADVNLRLIDDGKQRKKHFCPTSLYKNVPTETSCSHREKRF